DVFTGCPILAIWGEFTSRPKFVGCPMFCACPTFIVGLTPQALLPALIGLSPCPCPLSGIPGFVPDTTGGSPGTCCGVPGGTGQFDGSVKFDGIWPTGSVE